MTEPAHLPAPHLSREGRLKRFATRTILLLLVLFASERAAGQTRWTRSQPAEAGPAAPAALDATMTSHGAWLRWPPVPNASGYNVTRVGYPGTPETLIAARAASAFAFEGDRCTTSDGARHCTYFDDQFNTTALNLIVRYRVYAVSAGPNGHLTSPASPTAAVIWHCPKCPKVP